MNVSASFVRFSCFSLPTETVILLYTKKGGQLTKEGGDSSPPKGIILGYFADVFHVERKWL